MDKKGFTLVELLASLTILSMLMVIAVSSVLKVVDSNRRETYVEDAKKFVAQIEYNVRSNKGIVKPANGSCIAISLDFIDTADFKKAPSGGKYNYEASFVVLKNDNFTDKYYVRLIENLNSTSARGISMASADNLKGGSGKNKVVALKLSEIFSVNESNKAKISALLPSGASCSSLTVYS